MFSGLVPKQAIQGAENEAAVQRDGNAILWRRANNFLFFPSIHDLMRVTHQPGPFGDFGYGGGPGFPRHPADFFPPGAMGFLGPHPGHCRQTHHCCHLEDNDLSGLVPGMEQPLPMSGGCINPDQFSLPPR